MENKFNWLHPPFMLTPYAGEVYTPDVLVQVFNRLKTEGLYPIVFHDNPNQNLLEFMNFFSHPMTALSAIMIIDNDQIQDIAAIGWLSGLESYADKRQRALASFCVFKDYQHPNLTSQMARLQFRYWFEHLRMDILIGMTPANNRLAVQFTKRIGFRELCRIPNYSAYLGKVSDTVVTMMDREQYCTRYGGK